MAFPSSKRGTTTAGRAGSRNVFPVSARPCRSHSMIIHTKLFRIEHRKANRLCSNFHHLFEGEAGLSVGFTYIARSSVNASIANLICFILQSCSPTKVGKIIVSFVIIKMPCFMSGWTWSYKGKQDQMMTEIQFSSNTVGQTSSIIGMGFKGGMFLFSPIVTYPPTRITMPRPQ